MEFHLSIYLFCCVFSLQLHLYWTYLYSVVLVAGRLQSWSVDAKYPDYSVQQIIQRSSCRSSSRGFAMMIILSSNTTPAARQFSNSTSTVFIRLHPPYKGVRALPLWVKKILVIPISPLEYISWRSISEPFEPLLKRPLINQPWQFFEDRYRGLESTCMVGSS